MCRTGWSALYDETSDEEAPLGLHAEESQASSLSFQPLNLFQEHFAAAAATVDDSLSTLASGTKAPSSRACMRSRSTAQQQENQAAASPQIVGVHTLKDRRPWGTGAEGALGVDQNPDLPAASQSPAGKPPLPTGHRPSAKSNGAYHVVVLPGTAVPACICIHPHLAALSMSKQKHKIGHDSSYPPCYDSGPLFCSCDA